LERERKSGREERGRERETGKERQGKRERKTRRGRILGRSLRYTQTQQIPSEQTKAMRAIQTTLSAPCHVIMCVERKERE